jgi:hypothetical protein
MLKYNINIKDVISNGGFINIPLVEDFIPITDQNMLIENNTKIDVINGIVNYEKIKIQPIVGNSEGLITDDYGVPILTDEGDYITIDLNPLSFVNKLTFIPHFYIGNDWTVDATNLYSLGLIEDDIKYRRNRFKKSFLRLSYYDSSDLSTQNLLYFSTVFVDSGKFYGDYISSGDFNNLKLNFEIENPMFVNKTKMFEGFHIYLFKNDIPKNEIKTIYLKFEYNNAINGKTSLFLKNKPTNPSGYSMNELKENMFFAVKVKYDVYLKKYIYWIEDIVTDNNIEIHLYQAKVK